MNVILQKKLKFSNFLRSLWVFRFCFVFAAQNYKKARIFVSSLLDWQNSGQMGEFRKAKSDKIQLSIKPNRVANFSIKKIFCRRIPHWKNNCGIDGFEYAKFLKFWKLIIFKFYWWLNSHSGGVRYCLRWRLVSVKTIYF